MNTSRIAVSSFLSFLLASCAQGQAQDFSRSLDTLSQSIGGAGSQADLVARPSSPKDKAAVTVPSDEHVRSAMVEALPVIHDVLAIHQCVKEGGGMRQLNALTVAGLDVGSPTDMNGWPDSKVNMQYHDRNLCVSIRSIDEWSMPAMNALKFRVVYFAADSGETVNFRYLFKRDGDGRWLLGEVPRCPAC